MIRRHFVRSTVAVCFLICLSWEWASAAAKATISPPEHQVVIHALGMATPLGTDQPQGDVEEITCHSSLTCARCHILSQEFAQAAAQDYVWIDPSSCKFPEVAQGKGGTVWVEGITVMSDTLDSVRAAITYLQDNAPEEYRLPAKFLSLFDLSFGFSKVPLLTRGTSAGLAFLLSAYSAAVGIPIMPQVAVTGAIDEKGKVGPVGSTVNKVLAADRSGFSTVIVPAANAYELALLPVDLPKRVRIILADNAQQAFFHALGQAGPEGAKYDAMFHNYLTAISLSNQGDYKGALDIFTQLSSSFPEDYSLQVWIQFLKSTSPVS